MRKVLLSLAFVLATGSLVNANGIDDNAEKTMFNDCNAVYFSTRDFVHFTTGSLYVAIRAAIAAEEACLEEEEELRIID